MSSNTVSAQLKYHLFKQSLWKTLKFKFELFIGCWAAHQICWCRLRNSTEGVIILESIVRFIHGLYLSFGFVFRFLGVWGLLKTQMTCAAPEQPLTPRSTKPDAILRS